MSSPSTTPTATGETVFEARLAPDILGETTVCVAARSRAPFASAMCVCLASTAALFKPPEYSEPANAAMFSSAINYGEYDYAYSDKIRIPWAVDAGFRWVWLKLLCGRGFSSCQSVVHASLKKKSWRYSKRGKRTA